MANNLSEVQLDQVFAALADGTRREILARLAAGESNVRTLSDPLPISKPAVSKHLRVLERAGLIRRDKRGREHYITARAGPAEAAIAWVTRYAAFWKTEFDAVEAALARRARPKEQG